MEPRKKMLKQKTGQKYPTTFLRLEKLCFLKARILRVFFFKTSLEDRDKTGYSLFLG